MFFQAAQVSEMTLGGDKPANNFRNVPLSLGCRRAVDVGVWNGHSYEDVPATTIPMYKRIPRTAKEIMTRVTEVLTDHMYRDRPRVRRRRAI